MSTFYIPLTSYHTVLVTPDVKNARRPYPQILSSPAINVTGNFLGQGILLGAATGGNKTTCPIDSTVILYLVPRAIPAVVMPIAYITQVIRYTDAVLCSPNTNTVPATGSLSTLIEGNDGEPLNN